MPESRYASEMNPEQLREEISKLIAKDATRNNNLNYPRYNGSSLVSNMPILSAKAKNLRALYAASPVPMNSKIRAVQERNPTGFDQNTINNQLGILRNSSSNFTQNKLLSSLNKQFGESFNPYLQRFTDKTNKDRERVLSEAQGNFESLGRSAASFDRSNNEALLNSLNAASASKIDRRNQLINAFSDLGAQSAAYNNIRAQIDRNRFDDELSEPSRRLAVLADSLARHNQKDENPDIENLQGQNLLRALRTYGVNSNLPVERWNESRASSPVFKGEALAPINDQIKESYNLLERIDPKLTDSYSDERKNLVQNLLSNDSVKGGAFNLSESAQQSQNLLEKEAKSRLKKDLAALNNQYIKLGQFNSPQHILEANNRAREISRATLESSNRDYLSNARNNITNNANNAEAQINRLNSLYGNGQTEFNNVLSNVRELNNQGAETWKAEQAQREADFRNFQNENNWRYRDILGQNNSFTPDIYRSSPARDLNLAKLGSLNTIFSQQNRTLENNLAQDVKTPAAYWQQRALFSNRAQNNPNPQLEKKQLQTQTQLEPNAPNVRANNIFDQLRRNSSSRGTFFRNSIAPLAVR